jgi:GT2 family glycosyltransferase
VYTFIIIPVHNRLFFTKSCLNALRNQTIKDFHIVVIDDVSTDGTAEMIYSEYPDVILLHGSGNLWWTGATNLGVTYALEHGADCVMTLNDDTFPPPDFIENMMFCANRQPEALIGALAVDVETGQIVYGGEIINWLSGQSISLKDILKPEEMTGLHEVTHFPGRGLLIPSKVFKRIGLYDQVHFPQYAADYDFTHRAIRAGFKVYCNYDARLFIYPDASVSVPIRKFRSF